MELWTWHTGSTQWWALVLPDNVVAIDEYGSVKSAYKTWDDFKGSWSYQLLNLRQLQVVESDMVVIDPHAIISHSAGFDSAEIHYRITPPAKTYLTTEQFIQVWKSLSDDKRKELSAARYAARGAAWDAAWYAARGAAWDAAWEAAWNAARGAAWYAARYADLAVLVRDKITAEQFEILTQPWTSCGLSLFAEDWQDILNPKVTEPKGFGAIVEADFNNIHGQPMGRRKWSFDGSYWSNMGFKRTWSDLINPTILSEGLK